MQISIARFGRSVGLKGEMKLHILTDFPEQFQKGRVFKSDRGEIEIEYYNPSRAIVKLKGVNTPEEAKRYTNAFVYSDEKETKEQIVLKEGEHFWFEIIGCEVVEEGEKLGVVKDIQRFPLSDYLVVQTSKELIEEDLPKEFLIPYIDKFIQKSDIEAKKVYTQQAKDILKAS